MLEPDRRPMSPGVQLTGPYDSMREYVDALEATGRLLRIREMDQDRYEATGFAYRLVIVPVRYRSMMAA